MKKLVLIAALMVVWSGVFVRRVEADCVRKVKDIDYVTNAVIETGEAKPVGVNKAICDYTPVELGILNGAMHYRKHYTVLACGEDNKLSPVLDKVVWGWEKKPITECLGNCAENNDGTVSCISLVECKTSNGNNIEDRTWGCTSANSYGVCDGSTGTFKNIESCSGGGICNDGRWVGEEMKKYECKSSSCEKYGVTIPDGEKRCANGDVWMCTAGFVELADECDGSDCIHDDEKGWVCTGTDANNVTTCGQIDNGNGGTTSTGNTVALVGRSVCYGDRIYKCDTLPTFTYSGTDCTKNKDGKTSCCTTLTGGVQSAKCDTAEKCDPDKNPEVTSQGTTNNLSGETTAFTSIYNPLCKDGLSISTAFGCIPYDASGFAAKFLQLLFGIAGGIAFLLMVYGFILVATASGDEKKLQAAKETITSAITGLLISIFALFLFRLIMVNILQIPGIS